MTDLKTLIDKIDAPDEWEAIVRRTPTRHVHDPSFDRADRSGVIRRVGIVVLSLGMALLATIFVVRAFDGRPSAPPPGGGGADTDGGTYGLSEFEIEYPYDDPRGEVPPNPERAAVSFVSSWPAAGFPGNANCEMTLTTAADEVVGQQAFQLSSATDGARSVPIVVDVSGAPETATGSCRDDPEDSPDGVGYLFTGPTTISESRELPGGVAPPFTTIVFDVTLERPGESPGWRTCRLFVTRTDGSEDAPQKVNVFAGPGPMDFDVRGEPESIASAWVTCGPLEA